jgi:hypothetical protein
LVEVALLDTDALGSDPNLTAIARMRRTYLKLYQESIF